MARINQRMLKPAAQSTACSASPSLLLGQQRYCGVDNHPLQLDRLDGLHGHGRLDGGFKHLLDPSLAEHAPESPDLRRVTRQSWLSR